MDINFEFPKRLLVPRYGVSEIIGKPLRREEVSDDPLGELDRLSARATDLLVEPEIDNQFFRSSRHPTEVRLGAGDL